MEYDHRGQPVLPTCADCGTLWVEGAHECFFCGWELPPPPPTEEEASAKRLRLSLEDFLQLKLASPGPRRSEWDRPTGRIVHIGGRAFNVGFYHDGGFCGAFEVD